MNLGPRSRALRAGDLGPGPVLYWMSRDQRVADNWALALAQRLALDLNRPLAVVFGLSPGFLGATWRQYAFMLQGLREVEARLRALGIPLLVHLGDPGEVVAACGQEYQAAAVVMDFSPLRLPRAWKETVVRRLRCPVLEVDAHNLVPCWLASPKAEFAARTLRPKLWRKIPDFDALPPALIPHPFPWPKVVPPVDWEALASGLAVDRGVAAVTWCSPGESAAQAALDRFLQHGLPFYAAKRNDANAGVQSRLSPYLHFGHIAPWRVFHAVWHSEAPPVSKEAFLEELVVRREVAENFCFYNPQYDEVAGFPAWAQRTLHDHRHDPRREQYRLEELDAGATADPLWNAAQHQLVREGTMPGYVRMYWGKRFLEWLPSPEEALAAAILLNDRYQLDGRDPNGYANIAWCIGGVHDRPWFPRPIFGTVRSLGRSGCWAHFDVVEYVRRIDGEEAATQVPRPPRARRPLPQTS